MQDSRLSQPAHIAIAFPCFAATGIDLQFVIVNGDVSYLIQPNHFLVD